MEELIFYQRMNRGRHPESAGPEQSEYCIFYGPIREPVVRQRILGDEQSLTLELLYGGEDLPGELRLRQAGSNLVIEESPQGLFREFLEERSVKYLGQGLMYALQFAIAQLSALVEQGVEDMKLLENSLDSHIDNSGTYRILDFRRKYTEYGGRVIGLKEIIARIQADGSTQAGTHSYRDENGGKQLVVYKYLKDRGWVFMVRDSASEVYGSVMAVRLIVGALCAVMAVAVIFITLLILRREGRELMVVERAIGRLGDLNLSADQELEAFYGRSDEIGMIAQTTHRVCGCLRQTIDDVGRILGEMANGNLTVDVTRNQDYYIGDFRLLHESLRSIHANLVRVLRDITHVARQVDSSADRVSTGAQALSQGTIEQAASIDGLVTNVTAITSQIQDSSVRCGSASKLVDQATGYAAEADTNMEQLIAATRNIDRSSAQIVAVTKAIEDIAFQTGILALNASVEASHAGSAGKGFSVVAEEVRSLAAKSTEAAQNTNELIKRSIQDVKTGTESTDLAVSTMQRINECIQAIKTLMDEIAAASVQQSEMIAFVENGIKEISTVVQANSSAAKESAEVSMELSGQARSLNSLIGRFQIT